MKKGIAIFLCISLVVCIIIGCGSPKEPGRYYDKAKGFSINFPEGWTKTKSVFGVAVTFTDPEGRVKLSVQYQKIPKEKTSEELDKFMRNNIQRVAKIVEESEVVVDGINAHWFRCLVGTEAISYYIVMNGQDSYAIMATYDKDSTDEEIEDVIEASVDTFKFIK